MLDVITKADYFAALNDEAVSAFISKSPHDLKRVQDAYIFNLLKNETNRKIIEIGGGNSRVLGALDNSNELWNLDEFDGRDGGPNTVICIDGVKEVVGSLGKGNVSLPSGYFDILFSISVIEHVPSADAIAEFFREGERILKFGGIMCHAIDIYLADEPQEYSSHRIQLYLTLAQQQGLSFLEVPMIDAALSFKCRYASNPDMAMFAWNKFAPQLAELRAESQSVSLKMSLIKR